MYICVSGVCVCLCESQWVRIFRGTMSCSDVFVCARVCACVFACFGVCWYVWVGVCVCVCACACVMS